MQKTPPLYLQGLNGLRAIAALSVVLSHISLNGLADFGLIYKIDFRMAGYGVTMFFVISGFLITYLLLQEKKQEQSVNIRKFYIRRILRIWPIYYLFLILSVIVFFLLGRSQEIVTKELWYYVFFAANIPFIFLNGILIIVHYWSIGVEEQFYLIWPWIVKRSKSKLLKITFSIFLFLFLTKIGFWLILGSKSFEYRFINITRFHCMLIGVIGAILFVRKHKLFTSLFTSKFVQYVSWFLFLIMGLNIFYVPVIIGQELIALASLSMIMGQVTINNRIINLEKKSLNFIGRISYGIYITHPLIIILLSKIFKDLYLNPILKYILVYSTVVIVTIFVSWLSYKYFEKPFLKLKTKFAVVQSSNSKIV